MWNLYQGGEEKMLKRIWIWIKSFFLPKIIMIRFKAPKNDGELWTNKEEAALLYLTKHTDKTDKQLGKLFGRTKGAITTKRYYLKIKRKRK